MDYKTIYASPLGDILLTADTGGLTTACFVEQKRLMLRAENAVEVSSALLVNDYSSSTCQSLLLSDSFSRKASLLDAEPETIALSTLRIAMLWLDQYFQGSEPDFKVPLHVIGSDFQQEVWTILQAIPYGTTVSYGDIANQIADKRGLKRMSAQAVGGAVGRNPISIIVPCHRVIGANGKLVGYAGGMDKKIALLTLEGLTVFNASVSV